MPEHAAARRVKKSSGNQAPDDFDERAKTNVENVAKIHEFRRSNIREYEPPDKDFFDYDPNEKSRKYDGLKLESIFKYEHTYKALQWGVTVGGLFAAHRYYRTRSFDSASYWFFVSSMISTFNIWVSYGLQYAVTDIASRKSISDQARDQYHQGAYKSYI